MKCSRHNGFGLIFVVVIIGMISVTLAVLSVNTMRLLNETRRQMTCAQTNNLLLSALNWARANSNRIFDAGESQIILPDLAMLAIPHSNCQIQVHSKDADIAEIDITVQVQKQKLCQRFDIRR